MTRLPVGEKLRRRISISMDQPSDGKDSSIKSTKAGTPAVGGKTLQVPENGRAPAPLHETAQRDLNAALQLLAQRTQLVTGASGVAIALREGEYMISRASCGSAPEIGAVLSVNSGLSGESVRTRQCLRCDDAATDRRVNRETCLALGIVSAIVIPLIRENEIVGVFELFSSRSHAFKDHDMAILERLTEAVQTAIEQTTAITEMEKELGKEPPESPQPLTVEDPPAGSARLLWSRPEVEISTEPAGLQDAPTLAKPKPHAASPAQIRTCASCSFPVSEGRRLCVDCEASQANAETVPPFLAQMARINPAWRSPHTYLLGLLLLFLLVFAVLSAMR